MNGNVKDEVVCMSNKLIFPHIDKPPSNVKDNRSHLQILKDIICYINEQLTPQQKELWDSVCKRDISVPCYYRSGLAKLSSDLKKLSKSWKINKCEIDETINMPEEFKVSTHDKNCEPKDGHCNYFTKQDPKDYLENLKINEEYVQNLQQICNNDLFRGASEKSLTNMLNILGKGNYIPKTLVKKCKKVLSKGKSLSRHLIKRLTFMIKRIQLDFEEEVNQIYFNSNNALNLPLGEILPGRVPQESVKTKEIKPARFLIDSGSNVILCGHNTFLSWGFHEKSLQQMKNCTIVGSTGSENIILGFVIMPLYLKTDKGFLKTKPVKVLVTKESYPLDFVILGGEILQSINLKLDFSKAKPEAKCDLINQSNSVENCNLALLYKT